MSDTEDNNIRYEIEDGEYEKPSRVTGTDAKNEYEFEVNTDAVMRRLSFDIYNGKQAGIREPLMNSYAAIQRAIKQGYINKEQGIVEIELHENSPSERRLIIRDNGDGITAGEIDEVVSVIGKSTSYSDGEIAGKFGIGFLATWILTGGVDGGFLMTTNPRGVDEGPIHGVWDQNKFTEYDDDGHLNENEYGTVLDIYLDEDISTAKICDWIEKFSKYSQFPVIFKHNKAGETYSKEYEEKNILTKYEDIENGKDPNEYDLFLNQSIEYRYYTIEREYFTAVCSNVKDNSEKFSLSNYNISRLIILSSPMEINSLKRNNFPLNSVEIQIKTENPIVVSGPNKGSQVIRDSLEKTDDSYIHSSDLHSKDVVTPTPVGTRDNFEDNTDFIGWLEDKFKNIHYEKIGSVLKKVDTFDDYLDLSPSKQREFHSTIYEYDCKNRIQEIKELANTEFHDDFEDLIPYLDSEVSVAFGKTNGVSKRSNRSSIPIKSLIHKSNDEERDIFVGNNLKEKKCSFIWEDNQDHIICKIKNKSIISLFEKTLGWKRISDVDYKSSFDIDENVRKSYMNDDILDKYITLHIGDYSNTLKIKSRKFVNKFESGKPIVQNNDEYNPEKILLFKRGTISISNHKRIVSDRVVTISVTKDLYNELIKIDGIYCADKLLNESLTVKASNEEIINISEEVPENVVVQFVPKHMEFMFKKKTKKKIESWLRNQKDFSDNTIYAPITKVDRDIYNISIDYENLIKTSSTPYHIERYAGSFCSFMDFYAEVLIDGDTEAVEALKKCKLSWDNGGKELAKSVESYVR